MKFFRVYGFKCNFIVFNAGLRLAKKEFKQIQNRAVFENSDPLATHSLVGIFVPPRTEYTLIIP